MINIPVNTLPGMDHLPDDQTFPGNERPCINTPPIDPNFIHRMEMVRLFTGFFYYEKPDGLMLVGKQGTGKSSSFRQFCAHFNIPVLTVGGHEDFLIDDFLGANQIIDGDTQFIEGPLPISMRDGLVLLIEEWDRIPATTTVFFNSILDGYPLVNTLNGGEVIKPHPRFKVVATGNTAGSGDSSGLYNTAQILDASTGDRFITEIIDYMTPDEELAVLKRALGDAVPEPSLMQSIEFANDIRHLHNNDTDKLSAHASSNMASSMEITLSTRSLIRMWDLVCLFATVDQPIFHALNLAVTNKCSKTCATAVQKIAEAHFAGGTV